MTIHCTESLLFGMFGRPHLAVVSTATHATVSTVRLAALTHLIDHQIQNLLRVRFLSKGSFIVI